MYPRLIILSCLLLTGCLSSSPIIRYYLITSDENKSPETLQQPLSIEISSLQIPQYLDRSAIVTRTSNNRLRLSEEHQWAGNLRKNLLRVLALNLSKQLKTNHIVVSPNRSSIPPDYRIKIDIMQFELDQAGHLQLISQWQLFSKHQQQPIKTALSHLTSNKTFKAKEYDQIVEGMGQEFAKLSHLLSQHMTSKIK